MKSTHHGRFLWMGFVVLPVMVAALFVLAFAAGWVGGHGAAKQSPSAVHARAAVPTGWQQVDSVEGDGKLPPQPVYKVGCARVLVVTQTVTPAPDEAAEIKVARLIGDAARVQQVPTGTVQGAPGKTDAWGFDSVAHIGGAVHRYRRGAYDTMLVIVATPKGCAGRDVVTAARGSAGMLADWITA